MLVTPLYKKSYQTLNQLKICLKKIEGTLYSVFDTILVKKMQGISIKLFVLGRKFPNFVPRASSTLRNFPMFFAIDFWQYSDGLRKRLKVHVNVQQGLKRLMNRLLDLYFYWVTSHPCFVPPNKFPILDVIIIFEII